MTEAARRRRSIAIFRSCRTQMEKLLVDVFVPAPRKRRKK
jgi:hypothetical protein